jgi:hypothetical protein
VKAWVYQPRNSTPEIHMNKETVLEDMKDDFLAAQDNGLEWFIGDDNIYVDDGGHAYLVEVVE